MAELFELFVGGIQLAIFVCVMLIVGVVLIVGITAVCGILAWLMVNLILFA